MLPDETRKAFEARIATLTPEPILEPAPAEGEKG
jgi:hypothetical protein